jgi:hypothetical protein
MYKKPLSNDIIGGLSYPRLNVQEYCMSFEDQTTLLIECLDGKIEIAIKTDTDNPKTIGEYQNLASDWNEKFQKSPGADIPAINFIETGKPSTDVEEALNMGIKENLVVGFFLITMNFSFNKMEEGPLKYVLLISTEAAALILEERKKISATRKENKQLDNANKNQTEAAKVRVEITKEGHENIVLLLDINSEEDQNKLMKTIYSLNKNHDKEPPQ